MEKLNSEQIIAHFKEANEKIRLRLKAILKSPTHNADDLSELLILSNSFQVFPNYDMYVITHPDIPDREYWKGLSDAYQMADNLYAHREEVKGLFMSTRSHRHSLMTPYERRKLKALPDSVTIYRGMTVEEAKLGEADNDEYGISWTLSKHKAEFFAYTYWRNIDTKDMEKTVVTKQVSKRDIVAYFSERKEQEVIYLHT